MLLPTDSTLTLWCLGEFGLSLDDGPRVRPRHKVMELLVLLLLARDKPLSRSEIAAWLWPTADHESASTNLRQHIKWLRTNLGPQHGRVPGGKGTLRLEQTGVEVDAFLFREAVRQAREADDPEVLERVVASYTGRMLPDSEVEPIAAERKRLHTLYLDGLETAVVRLEHRGQREHALQLLWSGLEIDPLSEHIVGRMLRLFHNDITNADRVFATYRAAVERSFGLSINEKLQEQYRRIRLAFHRGRHATLSAEEDGAEAARDRLDRIPATSHPLIGRDEELERILARLDETRLVTVIGTGGTGKTRLALEAAHLHKHAHRDGVVFVDLAVLPPGASAERTAEVISEALEVEGASDRSVDRIVRFLAQRSLLLVLDNCEHLALSCVGLIRSLWDRCPHLTQLVTSRVELLSTLGAVVEIKPLGIPIGDPTVAPDDLIRSPTVQLFESLATQRRPDFRVTQENAALVQRICCATDGLPLAILLVASASHLTLTELAEQLAGGLGSVDFPDDPSIPSRSRTLLKSISWSYELLSSQEKELFLGLSIFVGGWTREAAETVFRREDSELAKPTTVLDRLCAKSLVERRELAERSRYYMLETVREVARRTLQESEAYSEIAQRHLDHYLAQAEALEGSQEGEPLDNALQSLTWEQENLRVALDHSMASGQIDKALRLAAALARFYYLKGRLKEGHDWLERVLAIASGAPLELRRRALHGAANLAYIRHDYEQAERLWNECRQLSHELGDDRGVCQAEGNLGVVAMALEDYAKARKLFENCLLSYRERDDQPAIARSLANLAIVANGEQDYAHACTLYTESIDLFLALGMVHDGVLGLNNLANTLIHLENYSEAHAVLAQAIDLSRSLDNFRHLAHCLLNYVMLAVGEGDLERAALLIGAEETLRDRIQSPLPIRAQLKYQPVRLRVLTELGEAVFTAQWNVGARASLPDLCRYVKDRAVGPQQ